MLVLMQTLDRVLRKYMVLVDVQSSTPGARSKSRAADDREPIPSGPEVEHSGRRHRVRRQTADAARQRPPPPILVYHYAVQSLSGAPATGSTYSGFRFDCTATISPADSARDTWQLQVRTASSILFFSILHTIPKRSLLQYEYECSAVFTCSCCSSRKWRP